jgi:2-iminobutanoate/2-iminopropanoate deaminase
MQKRINTDKAPKSAGPYSQAIKAGNFVFCSGQIGLNPKTNQLVTGGVEKETKQTLKNLLEVLKASKLSFKNVVKSEIFLTDIKNFEKVNKIYGEFFLKDPKPARVTVEVSNLPKGASIEISCIAYED